MKTGSWRDGIEALTSIQGRGYSAWIDLLALSVSRSNKAANQIFGGNDPVKDILSSDDSRQPQPRSAQLLHDAICCLIIRSCYNAPHIFAQRFVFVWVKQYVQDVDQPGWLTVGRKHGQTIKTGRSAKLERFLC